MNLPIIASLMGGRSRHSEDTLSLSQEPGKIHEESEKTTAVSAQGSDQQLSTASPMTEKDRIHDAASSNERARKCDDAEDPQDSSEFIGMNQEGGASATSESCLPREKLVKEEKSSEDRHALDDDAEYAKVPGFG
jgi:hypothetical protein